LAAACSGSEKASAPTPTPTPTAQSTPSPSPSPSSDETPVSRQALPPASDQPVANLCSKSIVTTADGNATPLLCRSGALNVLAWAYYANISASVLGLGLNPTEGQVQSAICDDLNHNHATRPEEVSGYRLATIYYGWAFNIDPTKLVCQ